MDNVAAAVVRKLSNSCVRQGLSRDAAHEHCGVNLGSSPDVDVALKAAKSELKHYSDVTTDGGDNGGGAGDTGDASDGDTGLTTTTGGSDSGDDDSDSSDSDTGSTAIAPPVPTTDPPVTTTEGAPKLLPLLLRRLLPLLP